MTSPMLLQLMRQSFFSNRAVPLVVALFLAKAHSVLGLTRKVMCHPQPLHQLTVVVCLQTDWLLCSGWGPKHQINRGLQLAPKHQGCVAAEAGLLHSWAVGPQHQGQVAVIVALVLAGQYGDLCGQEGVVESFNQAVALQLKGCCAGLGNGQSFADNSQHLGFEVSPLVTVQLSRDSKVDEHLLTRTSSWSTSFPRPGIRHCLYTRQLISSRLLCWLQYILFLGPSLETSAHFGGVPLVSQPLTFCNILSASCTSRRCWRSQGSYPSASLSTLMLNVSSSGVLVSLDVNRVSSPVLCMGSRIGLPHFRDGALHGVLLWSCTPAGPRSRVLLDPLGF